MYLHELNKVPQAAAGSGGLFWCWCKMRAATIDCVCLSVACHSSSLCGAVWTNDNSAAMTTWAQSTRHVLLSLCLTVCLFAFLCLNLSLLPTPSPPNPLSFLHCWCPTPSGPNWEVDTDKMRGAGREDEALMRYRKRKAEKDDNGTSRTGSQISLRWSNL